MSATVGVSRRALIGAALASASPAFAAPNPTIPYQKFALVIANANYDDDPKVEATPEGIARARGRGYAGDLANPWFDAVRVGEALRGAGFQVETFHNANAAMMRGAIMNHYNRVHTLAGAAGASVIYYAGHGIQLGGRNYLIGAPARFRPDTPLATAHDRELAAMAMGVGVQEILMRARAPGAPGYNVILIDACRDNPWEADVRAAFAREDRTYVGERGFGAMSVMTPRTVLSFSTQPGQLADDGIAGAGSPYAQSVVRALGQRNVPIDRALSMLSGQTAQGGLPWRIGRLGDDTAF